MKPLLIGLILIAATTSASAQIAAPIIPQIPGSSTTGTVTMSGCVTGGSGAGPITMMNPAIGPSTVAPGSVASVAAPITISPVTISPPTYVAPSSWPTVPVFGTKSPTAVGTTGITGTFPAGSVGVLDGTTSFGGTGAASAGYRLTGSDMNSWLERRVQVIGTMAPVTPEIVPAASATGFQEFHVQSVVPLTGPCPQR
jgi:hypothetical protein